MAKGPLYVARKSIIPAFQWYLVLTFWLIIPTFIIIWDVIVRQHYSIEFYDGYYIEREGVFNVQEKKRVLPKILGVSMDVSFFGYGDLRIDAVGKNDLYLDEIAEPEGLRTFLEEHFVDDETIAQYGKSSVGIALDE